MTAAGLTPYVAGGVGVYLLLSATGFLFPAKAADDVVGALRGNRALAHLTGAVAFFVGGAVVLFTHAGFASLDQALLSLTGLWWALEGAVALAAPQAFLERPDAARQFRRMNLAAAPVGLALIATAMMKLV